MPIAGDQYEFTQRNVDGSPDRPGVYQLSQSGTVIYIGRASKSIRTRLQSHYRGDEGACTKAATHYKREVCANPESMEVSLLNEFKRAYGRLPKCNDRVG